MFWKLIALDALVRIVSSLLEDQQLKDFSISRASLRGSNILRRGLAGYNVVIREGYDKELLRYRFYTCAGFGPDEFEELVMARTLQEEIPVNRLVFYDDAWPVKLGPSDALPTVDRDVEVIDGREYYEKNREAIRARLLTERVKKLVALVCDFKTMEMQALGTIEVPLRVEEAEFELEDLRNRGLISYEMVQDVM